MNNVGGAPSCRDVLIYACVSGPRLCRWVAVASCSASASGGTPTLLAVRTPVLPTRFAPAACGPLPYCSDSRTLGWDVGAVS